MSVQIRNCLLALAVLLGAGVLRMPAERALTVALRHDGLLREPVDVELRRKLGQGFWAVSLGGLRTLVATVLNLRAHHFFEGRQWTQLADAYGTIVQLAPATRYYWDSGHFHMAYNAASDVQNDPRLPELRRRSEWRRWIERGTDFLEEGIRQNPDDWRLWAALGTIHSHPYKIIDYSKAADAYRHALETGGALDYIGRMHAYALARVPGREDEAYREVREIFGDGHHSVPTLRCLRFALEMRAQPGADPLELAQRYFGGLQRAYEELGSYHLDVWGEFPQNGVAEALRALEDNPGVHRHGSIFDERSRLLEQGPPDPWKP